MTDKPFQRKGATSNSAVGKAFQLSAKVFFASEGLQLQDEIQVQVGISGKKLHAFDLGDPARKVVVECKCHKWTEGQKVPSAKMAEWNEAMYYFYSAPPEYRKVFFALKDYSLTKKETLAEYYIRTYSHMIPTDVEIWEFDEDSAQATQLR